MTMDGPVFECKVSFKRGGPKSRAPAQREAPVRIPRVSRLVALAVKLDGQIRSGVLKDWADLARLAHITRARASQLASLTLLAPDIIEQLLHLPAIERGRDSITEHHLRPITKQPSWRKQRRAWKTLLTKRSAE